MRIACIQFAPVYRDVAANLEKIRQLISRCGRADIVVLPELATTGYLFDSNTQLHGLAEPINGPTASALGGIAREFGVAIATGFMEASGTKYYNASLLFDATGALVGHYRKVHLFYKETLIFTRGDLGFPVSTLRTSEGDVRVGMMVCYDWRFPEAARALALAGAELIVVPSNIVTTTGMLHTVLATRAFENKVALAFADRVGEESLAEEHLAFRGESAIFNFNGEIMARASVDSEEIIIAEIDIAKTRTRTINAYNDIFGDRQRGGYGL